MFKVNGIAAILVVSVAATVTGIATAATVSQPQIFGCVSKQGALSKVSTKSHSCPKGTTALRWNTKGVQGEKGAAGANGDTGPAGPQGPSDLYFASGWSHDITGGATIATLNVPAGSYLATASIQFGYDSPTGQPLSGPQCEIWNQNTHMRIGFEMTEKAASQNFQAAVSVSEPTSFTLTCGEAVIGGNDILRVSNGSLSLLKVGAIHF